MKNLSTARCMDIPYNSTTDNDFDPVTIFCPNGKFNDLATLFLVRQEDAIRWELFIISCESKPMVHNQNLKMLYNLVSFTIFKSHDVL